VQYGTLKRGGKPRALTAHIIASMALYARLLHQR
jgi:hypothetical protein